MQLSKKDRVLLINQYRILAALDKDSSDHYEELIGILENGYEICYSMLDQWISDDMPTEEGKFVLNILDLYRAIESTKRSTKNSELMSHPYAVFRGFDGNNETEYMGFCRFLIEKQGKFQEQQQYLIKSDNFNSHAPMIDKYKRMLAAAKDVVDIWDMSADEAIKILAA